MSSITRSPVVKVGILGPNCVDVICACFVKLQVLGSDVCSRGDRLGGPVFEILDDFAARKGSSG